MKKIITFCVIFILSLQIYAIDAEEKNSSVIKESALISDTEIPVMTTDKEKVVVEEKKDEKIIVVEKKEKKKINKFIRIKGYFDIPGQVGGYQFGSDGTVKLADIDAGIEGMVEGVYRFSKSGEVAMGIGVQGIGNINTGVAVGGNNYAFPFYFSGKYNFFKSPVYLKGMLGITFNFGTDDLKDFIASQEDGTLALTGDDITLENGLYGAIGLGVDLGRFEIEGLYSLNTISSSYISPTDSKKCTRELENYKISVGASYAFDWKK